jgi:hypothetical protein
MKRRGFFKTLAAVPVISELEAQQPAVNPTQPVQPPGRAASEELPKITISVPDAAADSEREFFTAPQFSAFSKLSDLLAPGAAKSGAPDFLDFYIGRCDAARQRIYRDGLDGLNAQAQKQFGKSFSEIEDAQAQSLLAPLHRPWTYEEPADPVARFLREAKIDVRMATVNSRESGAGRRFAGSGLYWYPLD